MLRLPRRFIDAATAWTRPRKPGLGPPFAAWSSWPLFCCRWTCCRPASDTPFLLDVQCRLSRSCLISKRGLTNTVPCGVWYPEGETVTEGDFSRLRPTLADVRRAAATKLRPPRPTIHRPRRSGGIRPRRRSADQMALKTAPQPSEGAFSQDCLLPPGALLSASPGLHEVAMAALENFEWRHATDHHSRIANPTS